MKYLEEKMRVIQTILEGHGKQVLKWSGHVVGTEDNRWPRRIMTWLPEER
jgi:hypothetical protein